MERFGKGGISLKCWQDLSLEGYFNDQTPISLQKSEGLIFARGNCREGDSTKTHYLHPRILRLQYVKS